MEVVKHIDFIGVQKALEEEFDIPHRLYYDKVVLEHHMFKGNDTSMSFYNQFLEECVPDKKDRDKLIKVFSCLDQEALDIIFKQDIREGDIISKDYTFWGEQLLYVVGNYGEIEDDLPDSLEYYLDHYFIKGLYESLVMSYCGIGEGEYEKDGRNLVYWHFSW